MLRFFALLILVSQALGDYCIKYSFEENYNELFITDLGVCASALPLWDLGRYEDTAVTGQHPFSTKFIYPHHDFSCVSSFMFLITAGGTVEVNIYMDSTNGGDSIQVLVMQYSPNGHDSVVGQAFHSPSSHNFEKGWHTMNMRIFGSGTFTGYISIMGMAVSSSTVLVDSFRYIPPGMDDKECVIYSEELSTTESTAASESTTEPTTTEKVVESTTTEKVVESTTTEKIIEPTTTENIVESTTTEKIVESTTTEKIVESTTTEKIIEPTTTENIVESTTTEKIVESTTTDKTFESTTTEKIIEPTTTENIVQSSTTENIAEPTTTADESTTKSTTSIITDPTTDSTQALGDSCIRYTFEENYNEVFTTDLGVCASALPLWDLGRYEDTAVTGQHPFSTKFIYPHHDFSCVSSFMFSITAGGTVEVNIYLDSTNGGDSIQVLVMQYSPNGHDSVVGQAFQSPSSHNFEKGWHTMNMRIASWGTFTGYISIMGMAVSSSTVLVDSFRYIPPGMDDKECVIYTEELSTTESTAASESTTEPTTTEKVVQSTTTEKIVEPTTTSADESITTPTTLIPTNPTVDSTLTTEFPTTLPESDDPNGGFWTPLRKKILVAVFLLLLIVIVLCKLCFCCSRTKSTVVVVRA